MEAETIHLIFDGTLAVVTTVAVIVAWISRQDSQKSALKAELEKIKEDAKAQAVETGKLQTEINGLKEKTRDLLQTIKDSDNKRDGLLAALLPKAK